jgi:hypothetical protein
MDPPATQGVGEEGPWILLPSGPADRFLRSCYPGGWRIGSVDPDIQW